MRTFFLVAILASSPALSQEPTNVELAARIAGLEARMAQLEGRAPPAAPKALATSGKALEIENWRACKKNMTREEVIELLGEPTTTQHVSAVNQYPESETLIYGSMMGDPGGSVVMMAGRVVQCFAMNFGPD